MTFVCPCRAKIYIKLGTCQIWCVLKEKSRSQLSSLHADSEDLWSVESDAQLIWVFLGPTFIFVVFIMRWIIYQCHVSSDTVNKNLCHLDELGVITHACTHMKTDRPQNTLSSAYIVLVKPKKTCPYMTEKLLTGK